MYPFPRRQSDLEHHICGREKRIFYLHLYLYVNSKGQYDQRGERSFELVKHMSRDGATCFLRRFSSSHAQKAEVSGEAKGAAVSHRLYIFNDDYHGLARSAIASGQADSDFTNSMMALLIYIPMIASAPIESIEIQIVL